MSAYPQSVSTALMAAVKLFKAQIAIQTLKVNQVCPSRDIRLYETHIKMLGLIWALQEKGRIA